MRFESSSNSLCMLFVSFVVTRFPLRCSQRFEWRTKHVRPFTSGWESPSRIADDWPLSTKQVFTTSRRERVCSITIGLTSCLGTKNRKNRLKSSNLG